MAELRRVPAYMLDPENLTAGLYQLELVGAGDDRYLELTPAVVGGGGSAAYDVDDPANWTADLGYDAEFGNVGALPAGWSWLNQGASAFSQVHGAGLLAIPGGGSHVRGIERTLPAGASWTATFKLEPMIPATDFCGVGIAVRDAATNRLNLWEITYSGGYRRTVARWTTPTAFSSNLVDVLDGALINYRYWRILKNSPTSWTWQGSKDGLAWRTIDAARDISAYVANPTHIALVAYTSAAGPASENAFQWFRVR